MGYVVLHLDKSPDNEVPMTAHIARTKMPPNAMPELTYLNEELGEFPEGVADRTEAINHRLEHAGLTRKIGTNQVRVIRVMLTGTQEDMLRIVQEGRLKAWCTDNLAWLRKTFGAENVVSAVLHMDEATPHIHAAVVPIVTGERRKVRKEKTDETGKRKYRTKSTARPRLCADDVMSRIKLKRVPRHLCRSNGQIRTAKRYRRLERPTRYNTGILPQRHCPTAEFAGQYRRTTPH